MTPLLKGTKPDLGLYEVQSMISSIPLLEYPEIKLNISILISDGYWPKGRRVRIFKAADDAKARGRMGVCCSGARVTGPKLRASHTHQTGSTLHRPLFKE
jgi:hypothetical protein